MNSSCESEITFYPETCQYATFNASMRALIDNRFEGCKGKESCSVAIPRDRLPRDRCGELGSSVPRNQSIYFVQAACKSDEIDLFLLKKYYLKKEVVALVVILVDAGICLMLFLLF
jgi:hypothetical protein